MIVLLQRVAQASVEVDGKVVGEVGRGCLALVCGEPGDDDAKIAKAAKKTAKLRIFADDDGKMNRSLVDIGGGVLAVSQFTLAADCLSGNRPGFSHAAPPDEGRRIFEAYVERLRAEGLPVETGVFGADMLVSLVNDGPATFWLKL